MREGVGLTRAQNAVNMLEELVYVEGMEPVGEVRVVPDPATYTVLPWVDRTAGLLCDQLGHDGLDWGCCPRSFLKRAIAAAEAAGIRFMASFENEFYLAEERDGRVLPWANGPVYSSAGMDRAAIVMSDIVTALEAQGLEVEQAINEYGPGQQEIAVRYADALRAADNQLKFRDAVRGARQRSATASSPRSPRNRLPTASVPAPTSISACGPRTALGTSCTTRKPASGSCRRSGGTSWPGSWTTCRRSWR